MVFSSPIFLFGFLPIALFAYYVSPEKVKNITLLFFSLFFYAWGEVFYLSIMLASIVSNYAFGLLIDSVNCKKKALIFLSAGIVFNIGLLISFKYANFLVDNFNLILGRVHLPVISLAPIHLPLGISFFTFQAISYITDVYRKEVRAQRNMFDLALYISLFPQLIAGPIIRYHDIARQIKDRLHSVDLFASGVSKFIYGLAKKMLIANPLGLVTDNVFVLSNNDLTMPLAWIGILAYSLQIYFDFSGYSDMAIGLGRMFGFRFQENFNYPYIATSLREFWRRWHISLSAWFRDYVYFSLGGSRVSTVKVYRNLLIVFILTGIWHGASWNFLLWGLFHGFFLASEHAGFSAILHRLWKPAQHLYLTLVVIISWVFFRADSLPQALSYLFKMIDLNNYRASYFQIAQVITTESIYAFVIGIFLSTPVYLRLKHKLKSKKVVNIQVISSVYRVSFPLLLLMLSICKVASSTYNPFIYFRF